MEIPEDKLFRIIKLTSGQYEGEYRVYWNSYICSLFEPGRKIYKWGDCLEAEAGDWIETYDGTVLQILNKSKYIDKKKRIFYFYKFPMCTVYAWQTLKGFKYRQLQGNFMNGNRNTMRKTVYYGKDNQKVRFATYLVAGINPLKAYGLAFTHNSMLSLGALHRKVNILMTDKIVKAELINQLEPLIDRLNLAFPDDKIVRELELLLQSSRKGSDAHRENIKFIMALLNKLPDAMYPRGGITNSKKLAVNAEIIPPPQHMLE